MVLHTLPAVTRIRQEYPGSAFQPRIGIVLGTGLGRLVDHMQVQASIDYASIPNFPVSTVESHKGRLLLGSIAGKDVCVMQGRFHRYEGYTLQQVTFPVRVMKELGVTNLLISNASGGLNPAYRTSDIVLIDDHINMMGDNPLIGVNDDALGPRFPDMSRPYSSQLQVLAKKAANKLQHNLHVGVYVAVTGPCLETRAEYRFLRMLGADVVGMSTVPETIVARHAGMKVLALSIVTDECDPDALKPVSLHDILAAASAAEPVLTSIITEVIAEL